VGKYVAIYQKNASMQATHLNLTRRGSGPAKPVVEDSLDLDVTLNSVDPSEDGTPSKGSGKHGVAGEAVW